MKCSISCNKLHFAPQYGATTLSSRSRLTSVAPRFLVSLKAQNKESNRGVQVNNSSVSSSPEDLSLKSSPEDLLSMPIKHGSRRVGPVLMVKQVMATNPESLRDTLPIREAMMNFLSASFAGFPVLNKDGDLVGVLSMADIMWHEAMEGLILEEELKVEQNAKGIKKTNFLEGTVADSMTSPAITIPEDALISQAASLMLKEKINRVVVVGVKKDNKGKLVGMLTRQDIMKCMAAALM